MKTKKSVKITVTIVLVVIVIAMSTLGFTYGKAIFSPTAMDENPGTDVLVTIESGMGKSEVAQLLFDKGLIANKDMFKIQCYVYEAEFYAGEYTLNTSYTAEKLIDALKVDPDLKIEE